MGTVPGSSFAAWIQFIRGFSALIGKMRAAKNAAKGRGSIYRRSALSGPNCGYTVLKRKRTLNQLKKIFSVSSQVEAETSPLSLGGG